MLLQCFSSVFVMPLLLLLLQFPQSACTFQAVF